MTKKPKAAKVAAVKSDTIIVDKADPKLVLRQAPAKGKPSAASHTAKILARRTSKQAKVLEMLGRAGGVTIPQIMDATGWQQHSVRGFLSGAVKKKLGLQVISEKAKSGVRIYRIKAA